VDPAWIVNSYVALKSKPLAIFAGPERSGKMLLVKNLTQMLTQDIWRNQVMLGHAWWAAGSGNVALFTEAQVRLNSSKIVALIEDAALPENRDRVFIGWLNRISPAEMAGFFSELSFQLQHKRLMQLPSFHLTEPMACPPNFSLLGTMDTQRCDWSDEDLFSQTTVIPWPAAEVRQPPDRCPAGPIIPTAEQVFLRSCIRSEELALSKLHRVQGWRPQLMWPLGVISDLLRQHQVDLRGCAMGEVMIYVSNAWSADGEGLFDPAPARNLTIALDFAITQSLLLRAGKAIRDSAVARRQLVRAMNGRSPRSAAFLNNLAVAQAMEAHVEHRHAPQEPVLADLFLMATSARVQVADQALYSHE
jgi:hypothetical protein